MIGLRVTVPIACWRRGHAREYLETEIVPPPSTCYGMLLSLVGEIDLARYRGARVTAGIFEQGAVSTVLRTLWRIKDAKTPLGTGENAKPDFQQLVIGSDLLVVCEHAELEARVRQAIEAPGGTLRFGGLSLGESSHLINDLWLLPDRSLPSPARLFLVADGGSVTLPTWVDHVGSAGTRYCVGELVETSALPDADRVPEIPQA